MLEVRAGLLRDIREFFQARGVMEVDTPVLARYGVTDPNVENLVVPIMKDSWFLQTSPEYAMKRLLAAGSGSIYQITKAFRGGETGALHNVEFTLLEWYRPGWTMDTLMDEVEQLVRGSVALESVERLEYRALLARAFGTDVLALDHEALVILAASELPQMSSAVSDDVDAMVDLFYDEALARLSCTAFVHRFPPGQAALAQLQREGGCDVALRFELVLDGVEIANGYQELTDADEQKQRFVQDNVRRKQRGRRPMEIDERLLAAMAHGLPECAGVALGVDRLLMRQLGTESLADVMPFPHARA